MHAGAQDLVGLGDVGIGKLLQAEFGFHVANLRAIRPRLRMFFGSKLRRTRSPSAASPAAFGWENSDPPRPSPGGGSSVAGPPAASPRGRSIPAPASADGDIAAQINPPPQS